MGGRTYIGDAWEKRRKIPITNPIEPTKPSIKKVRSLANETDTSGYVSGLYQYDNDDIPTNILRADGLVKLGGDKLTIDIDGNLILNEPLYEFVHESNPLPLPFPLQDVQLEYAYSFQ